MVGKLHKLPLLRGGKGAFRMVNYSVPNLPCEVQPRTVPLKLVHHPKALLVVAKAAGTYAVQGAFPGVAEGRVPEVVAEGYRLREIFIKTKRHRHGAGDLRHL